ncbi:MAG: UDP-glucose 4-epimerase GalE [Azospirillum brasilense]|nr:MAG: UDP-glucose 4-epimerase GalE [Azospirillum brasilense]
MGSILVTGGAGYIGSHAVLALRDAGFAPVVLDDLSTGFRQAVPADVPFVQGSVGDEDLLAETMQRHRVSAVMHFAAFQIVPESVEQPLEYWRNNVGGVAATLGACLRSGVRHLVFSSTAAVYGIPETLPVPEDAPCEPITPYGSSKHAAERMILDVARAFGLSTVTLRYFNVAGADPAGRAGQRSHQATHLIKVACEVATGKRDKVEIFGTDYPTPDGTGVRDYVHVSDLADAHVAALRHILRNRVNLTMNCGYGWGYSVREVLTAVERVNGAPLPIVESPRRAGDPPSLVAAVDRLQRTLDWRPRYEALDFIIRSALDWEAALAAEKLS